MELGRSFRTLFSAGELGPEYAGRFDLEPYQEGVARLENAVVIPSGGITKMPGTEFLDEAYDEERDVRLLSFVYNQRKAYILEFGHEYLRIWDQHGDVVQVFDEQASSDAQPPWHEDDLFRVQMAGIEEYRVIVCLGYRPRMLTLDPILEEFTLTQPEFDAPNHAIWDHLKFHEAANWPAVVSFFEERLIFANTPSRPTTVFGSRVGVPTAFDFEHGVDVEGSPEELVASDTWQHQIATRDASEILWVDAYGVMIVGTSTGEFTLRGGQTGIQADSFLIRPESTYGSHWVEGRLFGDSVIFLQRYGKRVREYVYQDLNSPFAGSELSIVNSMITESGIRETTFMQDPYPITWFVRNDGVLAAMTRDRQIELMAWGRHLTKGKYLSVSVLPAQDRDQLWAAVRRTVGGDDKVFIERFDAFHRSVGDGVFLHSAVVRESKGEAAVDSVTTEDPLVIEIQGHSYAEGDWLLFEGWRDGSVFRVNSVSGDDLTMGWSEGDDVDASEWDDPENSVKVTEVHETVDGLDHLEDEDVGVMLDGGLHADRKVEGGEILLDRWAKKSIVGLRYRALAETLPGLLDMVNKMSRIVLRFHRTVGCQFGDTDETLREMLWKTSGKDPFIGPAPLFTGDKRDLFPGKTKRSEGFVIANDYPLPWTVLAVSIEAAVEGEG